MAGRYLSYFFSLCGGPEAGKHGISWELDSPVLIRLTSKRAASPMLVSDAFSDKKAAIRMLVSNLLSNKNWTICI